MRQTADSNEVSPNISSATYTNETNDDDTDGTTSDTDTEPEYKYTEGVKNDHKRGAHVPQADPAWNFFSKLNSQKAVLDHLIKARVRLVHRKHIAAFNDELRRYAHVAADRARQHSEKDCTAVSFGLLLHLSLPRMLFAKTKSSKPISGYMIIKKRLERFHAGDWEALWNEAAPESTLPSPMQICRNISWKCLQRTW